MYQSTSPSGAVTPTVAMPSSIRAHTWRAGRYWRSEGRAKRADGAVATTEISDTKPEPDASPGRKAQAIPTIRQGASAGPSSASVQRSVKVAALSFEPLTTAAVSRSST